MLKLEPVPLAGEPPVADQEKLPLPPVALKPAETPVWTVWLVGVQDGPVLELKLVVTFRSTDMTLVHVFVNSPTQSPSQLLKVQPFAAVAFKVILVSFG